MNQCVKSKKTVRTPENIVAVTESVRDITEIKKLSWIFTIPTVFFQQSMSRKEVQRLTMYIINSNPIFHPYNPFENIFCEYLSQTIISSIKKVI